MRGSGEHPQDTAYAFGFGSKQRDIVIPAFLSAYTDKPPESMDIEDAFDWLPRPNWQLTYNGLQKIPLFAELFSSVRLTHGYKSTLSINSFETDLSYTEFIDETFVGQQNPENINLATQNYFSRYIVPSVIIDEEFSPLVGVEVKTKNDINLRFNYGKRRGLRLGLTDYILEEDRATSIEFGFDYAIKNVVLPFGNKKKKSGTQEEEEQQGGGPVKGNNLELIFDFGFKDNITVNHTLDQESLPIPTRGTKEIVISPAVRYNLNKNVDLRFFVNYRKSEPYTTITYPITRIDGGITVQITLE
jgi:cell surface protein SprA